MRLALAIVLCAGVAAAAPSKTAVGFEHQLHDRDVVVSGAEAIPCGRCHAMKNGALVGKPDHATCFSASCHQPAPRRGERFELREDDPETKLGQRLRICTSCHAEAALADARTYPVHYPPYTLEPNFAITVGHKRHAQVACGTCHVAHRPAPHKRCAGCHDGGKAPAMTACSGCHTPATGTPLPPTIVAAEINVHGAFSHAKHAARSERGARCTTCHASLLETDDNVLPAPAVTTCAAAKCHDGTTAFGVTVACTKCHRDPNKPGFTVERPTDRYSHGTHADTHLPCAACHPLTKTGEVLVGGHAPCVRCHASDFGQRKPKICGACHNGTEPWRPLVPDRGPVERTEFGATLDHAKHPGECADCHSLTTAATQLRPPRGHRSCASSKCHAIASGPEPRMTACEGCHRLGRALDRQVARLQAPWSVRTVFDHARHARDRIGAPLLCNACHTDLSGADVVALPTPAKATCAPCHDGTTAFKLTGTTCMRCHRGGTKR